VSRASRLLPAALVALLALALPGCIVLRDDAGVDVPSGTLGRFQAGSTTRAEVLALLGPPTGRFSTNLLAAITRTDPPIEAPATPGRIDDDVLTWQSLHVRAHVAFFPVLFTWVDTEYSSRTLTVWFDADGRVRYAAFREDSP
jgi:hypothetical protein